MKRKIISSGRSAEIISDKRLRTEVQPAQTNGLENVKPFVNIRLHCIVSRPVTRREQGDEAPLKNISTPWKNVLDVV